MIAGTQIRYPMRKYSNYNLNRTFDSKGYQLRVDIIRGLTAVIHQFKTAADSSSQATLLHTSGMAAIIAPHGSTISLELLSLITQQDVSSAYYHLRCNFDNHSFRHHTHCFYIKLMKHEHLHLLIYFGNPFYPAIMSRRSER